MQPGFLLGHSFHRRCINSDRGGTVGPDSQSRRVACTIEIADSRPRGRRVTGAIREFPQTGYFYGGEDAMEQQLQAIATVLMFARIESGQAGALRVADATKAALAVLVVAALVGTRVLQVFGISPDAFAVAGACSASPACGRRGTAGMTANRSTRSPS
jgi:hypothetical protein